MKVRDAFYEILRTHGITIVFGNPGSNELPMLPTESSPSRSRRCPTSPAPSGTLSSGQPHLIEISQRRLADS